MSLSAGTRLGPYEILAPLGAGGMGEVYRARDTRLGRDVAVKIIPRALAAEAARVKRFELEARAAGALNHPNIVSVFDVGAYQGTRFVVMELAEGRTLRDVLKAGRLGIREAAEYALQAAGALEAAHAKGIIHRDLTPGNVMVSRDGRVKVLDFGLAKLEPPGARSGTDETEVLQGTAVTEPGTVAGTVPYMAPEQLRGGRVDGRTDLFALGILLYEMVTGRRPFVGATSVDVTSAILRDPPPPARSVRGDLPEDLEILIARCLEKDPAQRIPSARELGEQLKRVLRRLDSETRSGWPSAAAVSAAFRPQSATPRPIPPTPSIAVLPFANRSHDANDEYFSDGLADELLNVLAKIPGLRVVGRTSSYQFKGRTEDLRDIGRKLNVATLLEGSVRKTANRVRITVQLVKVADGFHLWAESYDRTLDDLFAVQDDIAQSVVKELRTTLLGEAPGSGAGAAAKADVAVAARGRGGSGEAYRLFLQGRYFVSLGTRDDLAKGIGYLVEALELDPTLALGWAELSGAYASQAGYGWYPIEAGSERAREAAERAIALEPGLAEGYVRLGSIQMNYDRNWRAAEQSFRHALALAPGNASVLRLAGNLTSNLGRLEEAIELYRRAVDQDPLSAAGFQGLAIACQAADRLREAEAYYRMSLELAPQRIGTRCGLALVLLALGRHEEAAETAAAEPEEVFRLMGSAIVLHARGRRQESDAMLRAVTETYAEGGAYQIAEIFGARGEIDAAFEWLERAYAQHDGGLVEMKPEPLFRSLHGDPRWGAFLSRLGLGDPAL